MSSELKLRRGSTAAHTTFTGADGEVTFDTDKNVIVSHDGATVGGFPHIKAADLAAPNGAALVTYLPAGTGAVDTDVQRKLRESVSVLDFIPTALHASIADGTNTTPLQTYIQASIDTAQVVYFPSGIYGITAELTPAPVNGRFDLRGSSTRKVTIQALTGFVGSYMLHATGAYDLRDITLVGIKDTLGIYGLGTNTAGTSGGAVVLDGVTFFFFDECVSFGPEYEHPLALNYDRVYCQFFMRAGINIGGLTGIASSGESNFDFGRITITNARQTRTEYATSVTVNTPSTSYDRLTWAGTVPTYGFLVMRSADGSTGWHVPPNGAYLGELTALTMDAAKTVGETWFYKVVPNTIGLLVRRAKAISGGSIQTEYVGIGQYYLNVQGAEIGSIYYEVRDEDVPCPSVCAVAAKLSLGLSISSGWVDKSGYGLILVGNSSAEYKNVRHSSLWWAAIGIGSSTATNVRYNGLVTNKQAVLSLSGSAYDNTYSGSEYSADVFEEKLSHATKVKRSLALRGAEKSGWSYDSTNGTQLTGLNLVDIKPFSKTVMRAPVQSTGDSAILTNNVATAFASFTVALNSCVNLTLAFVIGFSDAASVARQVAGGTLTVSAVSASGTVVAGVNSLVATAVQGGTLVSGPTFTTSIAGAVVTVLCHVNSDINTSIRLLLTPVSSAATVQPTALTQA
jgi:hypothetical protein